MSEVCGVRDFKTFVLNFAEALSAEEIYKVAYVWLQNPREIEVYSPSNPTKASGAELFSRLESMGIFSISDAGGLIEIAERINRPDLVEKVKAAFSQMRGDWTSTNRNVLSKVEVLEAKVAKLEEDREKDRLQTEQKLAEVQSVLNNMELDPQVSDMCNLPNGNPSSSGKSSLIQFSCFSLLNTGLRGNVLSVDQQRMRRIGEDEVSRPGAVVSRIKQNVEMLQSTVQRLSEVVQTTRENQTRSGIAIDDMRLRQDILDVKVTGGVLIWKIPDLRRRYRDAVDRRTISLYSPPFYTSPHGYRMCIRTYLNGDGIGKGTHVSLFFVLMRSEHDNLLPWPFKQSVRFTLINQKNPGASISEAFIPDVKSASFHKPESEMNVASGFPKFARQSVLKDENYTTGDMIFIKCQVDSAGLKLE